MASSNVTFPCPFCSRRMGVPPELLGRQVRCPHCKQVVLAPATAGQSAPVPPNAPQQPAAPPRSPVIQIVSPPQASTPAPTPPPAQEHDLPMFNLPQRKEGPDSIMGEAGESEDEVFGSQASGPALPRLELDPEQRAPAEPTRPPDNSASPSAAPALLGPATDPMQAPAPGLVSEQPSAAPTSEFPNPFDDLEPVSLPAEFAPPAPMPAVALAPVPAPIPQPNQFPQPQPVQLPLPAVTATPSGDNPFAEFDSPAATPTAPGPARPVAEELPPEEPTRKRTRADRDEPDERPARPGRARPAGGSTATTIALFVVIAYAAVATAAAVYGLFFKSGDRPDTGHPLSTIPDNFGEFDPATRKKVTAYRFPVDGELPAAQRAGLGETITIGQLEIQPKKIEKRRLVIETEQTSGAKHRQQHGHALVLTLRITNKSDLSIYPMDPAFTRKGIGHDHPITRLVVGREKYFAGGAIQWPHPTNIKREMEVQQANDYIPLAPNESREYVVFTDVKPEIIKAVEGSKEPMQWRVQVRRAPIEFRGKEMPVSAIIGVDFKASDIP